MVRLYLCFFVIYGSWDFIRSENLFPILIPLKGENNLQLFYWVFFSEELSGMFVSSNKTILCSINKMVLRHDLLYSKNL